MKGLGVGWDEQIHFIRSDDFFASAHKKLASCGNQFEIAGQKVKHLDHEPSVQKKSSCIAGRTIYHVVGAAGLTTNLPQHL